jgi:GxxExxY protein
MFDLIPETAEFAAKRCLDAAFSVHKRLGPGLLESAYQHCLAFELGKAETRFQKQVLLPLRYDGLELDAGYRIDFIVERSLVVQIKAVEAISPLHEAQVLTYLKLSGLRLGLLINFNVPMLKQGLRRFAL